jgi:glutaconyl-CoA/methylmalonyl-CoA decarboxylase subunit gamma
MAREVIESPMPGKIISIKIKVGDNVKEDDELMILEAMKMENPIVAPISGRIAELNVSVNATVTTGQTLAVIQN